MYNNLENNNYNPNIYPHAHNQPILPPDCWEECINLMDHGPNPYTVNIEDATKQNTNYRTTLWTGSYLQLTLMSINPREDIGLEMHPDVDQFIRIEQGQGVVVMGDTMNNLYFQEKVYEDHIILIPAGKWHNLINTGCIPIKLYSLYAPPEHPHGTVHRTKEESDMEHGY